MDELTERLGGRLELPDHDIDGFEGFGHITLEGAPNTRDLGGMPAADGLHVRPHRLIRSGALSNVTADDARVLTAWHQVRRVVDLRTVPERDSKPDAQGLLPGVEFIDLPVLSIDEVSGLPSGAHPTALHDLKAVREYLAHPYEAMGDLYSEALLGAQGRQAYSRFLELLLAAEEGATLWHCTEGKDRAGLATVLVELALGVSRDDILQDYLATNLFVQTWAERALNSLAKAGMMRHLDADVSALFYAYEEFLANALQLVEDEFGSLDGYLERGLGFGAEKQAALRERYLTDQAMVPTEADLPDGPPPAPAD